MFGLQWLRKAILRSNRFKALHDEDEAFAAESDAARRAPEPVALRTRLVRVHPFPSRGCCSRVSRSCSSSSAFGASAGDRVPAVAGAASAFFLVLVVGIAVHRPLSRVPENLIKHGVGLMLSTFGLFWLVEGLNAVAAGDHPVEWPGGDVALPVILLAWIACSQLCMWALRRTRPAVIA